MKKGLSVIVNKTASITNTNNGKSLAAGKTNSSTLRVVLRKDEIDNSGTILLAPSSSRGSAEKEDPSNVKSNASKKCKRYRNRYLKILNIYAKIFFPLLNIHCSLHPLLLFLLYRKKEDVETSTSSLEEDIEMLSFDSRTESSSLPSSQVFFFYPSLPRTYLYILKT